MQMIKITRIKTTLTSLNASASATTVILKLDPDIMLRPMIPRHERRAAYLESLRRHKAEREVKP